MNPDRRWRPSLHSAVAVIALAGAVPAALAALEQSATVTRSFTLSAVDGQRTLVIENLNGAIEIEGGSGDTVELTLTQTFEARSAADLALARQEVTLEVSEQPGRLELVQHGPWSCRGREHKRRGDCCCDHEERDYEVTFDWKLKVPRQIDLDVSDVNEGAIRITGISGRLEVDHVNDDVTLVRVSGIVDANTVNGELKVDFAALPTGDCSFATVNGDIDLAFPKGLGAELSFATMNGEVYTDFPFELAKLPPTSSRSRSGGRQHHEVGGRSAATLGGGGIGLACQTLNGDITIRERS